MWSNALRIATEAKAMAEQVGALTRAHIDDCSRRSEKLALDLERRDERARSDLDDWRKSLGQRLDRQDRMTLLVAGFVITALLGIIGTLLHTYGFVK